MTSRVTFGVLVALPMKFVAKGLRFKVSGTYYQVLMEYGRSGKDVGRMYR